MVDQTTHPPKCHSFVGLDRQIGSSPPALDLKRERTEGRKREKFYIYLDVTHTQQSISSRIGNYWKRCTKATRNGDGHVQRLKPSNLGSPNSTAQWKLSSYIK